MDPFVLHHRKIDDSVYIMDEDVIEYDMIGGIGFLLRDVVFENEENKEIFQIRYYIRKTGIKF